MAANINGWGRLITVGTLSFVLSVALSFGVGAFNYGKLTEKTAQHEQRLDKRENAINQIPVLVERTDRILDRLESIENKLDVR
jgi:hypothetical protein